MKFFNGRYRDAVGRWQIDVCKAVDADDARRIIALRRGNCFHAWEV